VGKNIGKKIAHVRPLILAHAAEIGELIDAIEKTGKFEVVADKGERGSFKVLKRGTQG